MDRFDPDKNRDQDSEVIWTITVTQELMKLNTISVVVTI